MMIIKVSSPSSSSRTSGVLFYRQNNTQRSRSNIFPPYPRALVQIRTARKVSRLDSRSAPLRSFSFYSTFERVLPRARVIDHQICFRERLVVHHFFWRCCLCVFTLQKGSYFWAINSRTPPAISTSSCSERVFYPSLSPKLWSPVFV